MHNYCEYYIDEFDTRQYLQIFYILDKIFIEFLTYIDCTRITLIWNDMCLADNLHHKLYNYRSKIFLVLITRRGNNFSYRWCDAMIVDSSPLLFFLRIWVNNWGHFIMSQVNSYFTKVQRYPHVFLGKHRKTTLDMAYK